MEHASRRARRCRLPAVTAAVVLALSAATGSASPGEAGAAPRRERAPARPAGALEKADDGAAKLAEEVAKRGWLVFSARSPKGDYDLYLARPDGSALRNITDTPNYSEFGGRFSPDGKRMLYRRARKGHKINHDLWGSFGALVIANADGSDPAAYGRDREFPWACWGPEGKRLACLYKRRGIICIHDLKTKKVLAEMPRQGIFQQTYWSRDGKRLCGTANVGGRAWKVVSLEIATRKLTVVSRQQNCTPDWFQGDAARVIYCNRRPGLADRYGFTMLMQATADGKHRTLVYGEWGKHVYFACTSPDDKYVIFTRLPKDGMTHGPMAIVRLADTPMVVGGRRSYKELRALYPKAKSGPVLHLNRLPHGFEPHWTYAEIGGGK